MSLESGGLIHVDEESAAIVATVETGSSGYNVIEVTDGAIWFAGADMRLRKFDAAGVEVGSLALEAAPEGLAIGDGSAWVQYYQMASGALGRVDRIDLSSVTE